MSRRSPLMNMMVRAAEEAAKGLRRDFGDVAHLQVSKKALPILYLRPTCKLSGRLSAFWSKPSPKQAWGRDQGHLGIKKRWIVDSLDGTTNFLHGHPAWAISIAFEADGVLTHGSVYDVMRDEPFGQKRALAPIMGVSD